MRCNYGHCLFSDRMRFGLYKLFRTHVLVLRLQRKAKERMFLAQFHFTVNAVKVENKIVKIVPYNFPTSSTNRRLPQCLLMITKRNARSSHRDSFSNFLLFFSGAAASNKKWRGQLKGSLPSI